MNLIPIFLSDSYKQFHWPMYPKNLVKLYSNMTPRKSRAKNINEVVFFGLQYYIKEYLILQWNDNFFYKDWDEIEYEYKRFHRNFSQVKDIDASNWKALHELGYMPIKIKALMEGTLVPIRVPFFTITNTDPGFAWLVNFLETQISTCIWDMITVATISHQYRLLFDKYALETVGNTDFVQWQGHDFSMRGRSSIETSYNQAGHLLSFTGSDTIPAVLFLEEYYNADMDKELIAGSVPASEHSVMMCLGKEGEIRTFEYLLDTFPTGLLSVVSDTWNLWDVLTVYLPQLKDKVLARDGKLVIRPDSGDPVNILCGYNIADFGTVDHTNYKDTYKGFFPLAHVGKNLNYDVIKYQNKYYKNPCDWTVNYKTGEVTGKEITEAEAKGVVECLWDVFGGIINYKGFKELNSHIGCIYGDAITLERAEQICERLKAKGFASTNWVAGIGSYTFNYNTRDTFGMAIKATYCELEEEFYASPESLEPGIRTIGKEIFKDPITDDGEKKSAKGLLQVYKDEHGKLKLKDQCTKAEETQGLLKTVFEDGKLIINHSLEALRFRLKNQQ